MPDPTESIQRGSVAGDDAADVTIAQVRFEHCQEAFGLGIPCPRLSWTVATSVEGWYQAGYEIQAYGADGRLREQTGRVESDHSVLVPWPFAPLASRECLTVRLRVWGSDGQPSAWSTLATVEVGLLHAGDWSAQFITSDWEEDTSRTQPCPFLRHEFDVRAGVTRARLYATALGVYEAQLNGQVIGDQVLAPGWTSYKHRLCYQTFDVTTLVHEGRNTLGALLGNGWYRGRIGFNGGRRNIYGERLALLTQLEISYADGTTERVVSDETWRASYGPVLASEIYDGETYDARLELSGWSEPGYDDHGWRAVRECTWDLTTLVAPSGPPVRRIERIAPVAIMTSPMGRTILDFGQNLVGRLRLMLHGEAGQEVMLRHAEILENDELCTRPLRLAQATDRYILRGEGTEVWEPHFTFHGFRYAEVTGWPGSLQAEDVCAIVCHSDLERTGWFECSDPLLNRLHENVVWGMRGNFLAIPTDCPQRDERLGWTGDIQVFAPASCFLYNTAGFLSSWLADLAVEQSSTGVVPLVIPDVLEQPPLPAAVWGDAAVIVPWVLYQRYGDVGILEAQFESMRSWVDLVSQLAGERHVWNTGFQLGDWLDPSAPPDKPNAGQTDPYVVANAYFAHSAELVGLAAEVLGRGEDAARYRVLASRVREAFANEYILPDGHVHSDSATAYALALQFGLLQNEEQRRLAGKRLAALVAESGYHISTGFVGTPLICDALCDVGEYETAFRLLNQRECPSWLYPVTMDATTIWERWDSMLPDGSVNPGEMTSFNHYAFGAIADWLQRTVGGLAPGEAGYRRIVVRPQTGGGLTYACARLKTPYGLAESSWRIEEDGLMKVQVLVPPGTTASVSLPGKGDTAIEVRAGRHEWSYAYQVSGRQDVL